MFPLSNSHLGIGTYDTSNIITVRQNSATEPIADAWTTYSSRRWKTNIQVLDGALEKVLRLRPVYFDWKATGKHDLGLVAEEVGQVIPEVVAYEQNGQDARSVDYGRLTALLVEAIKEQQAEIEELKAEILARPMSDTPAIASNSMK
jgi:Chaperone of endosialidase